MIIQLIILLIIKRYMFLEIPLYYSTSSETLSNITLEKDLSSSISLININFHSLFLLQGGLPTLKLGLGNLSSIYTLLFDTGSHYLALPNLNCSCSINNYDNKDYFKEKMKLRNVMFNFEGGLSRLNLSINNLNMSNFDYFAINQSDMTFSNFDGILGMNLFNKNLQSSSSSFINELYDYKALNKRNFLIKKSLDNEFMLNFDSDILSSLNQTNFTFCNTMMDEHHFDNLIYSNQNWQCNLSNIFFGNDENFSSSIRINDYAGFSTGINYIVAPYKFLSIFLNIYFKGNKDCHKIYDGSLFEQRFSIICLSDNITFSDFDSMSLVFNGYSYIIPSRDLFMKIKGENQKNYYLFRVVFALTDNSKWIIGQPFLKQNEIILFDYDDLKIWFKNENKHNYSSKVSDIKETHVNNATLNISIIYGTLIIISIVVIVFYVLTSFCSSSIDYSINNNEDEIELELKVFKGLKEQNEENSKSNNDNDFLKENQKSVSYIAATTNLFLNASEVNMNPGKVSQIFQNFNKSEEQFNNIKLK